MWNLLLQEMNKDDNNKDFVKHIQAYMFNSKTIVSMICHRESVVLLKKEERDKKDNDKKKETIISTFGFFVPIEKDSLFWCLYTMKNGIEVYSFLPNRNFITEKRFK